MSKLTALSASLALGALSLFALPVEAQISASTDLSGRRLFINADPPVKINLSAAKHTNFYLPREAPFAGRTHPFVYMDRDGVEKLVREAADRHRVDPALIRAVIQTESNWNPAAYSNKGAGGLMQLIPTTARRFGVTDVFTPQQNIEGALERAHGIAGFRERRSYARKVQKASFQPGSGHLTDSWLRSRPIRRET